MGEKKHDELWTIKDLMAYMKVPRSTVFILIATKQIPSIKVGRHRRFIPSEVERALKRFNK